MPEAKFYQCKQCKNILLPMRSLSSNCCREDLELITVNSAEASFEKHIPVFDYAHGILTVKVGSVPHPMTPQHYIPWIYVETRSGALIKYLTPEDQPKVTFQVEESEILNIYAYCNLHGLWKADTLFLHFSETVCSPEFLEGCKE